MLRYCERAVQCSAVQRISWSHILWSSRLAGSALGRLRGRLDRSAPPALPFLAGRIGGGRDHLFEQRQMFILPRRFDCASNGFIPQASSSPSVVHATFSVARSALFSSALFISKAFHFLSWMRSLRVRTNGHYELGASLQQGAWQNLDSRWTKAQAVGLYPYVRFCLRKLLPLRRGKLLPLCRGKTFDDRKSQQRTLLATW